MRQPTYLPLNKRGYVWQLRQSREGMQNRSLRLRLDGRNVARIYERPDGTVHVVCYDRPDGTEVDYSAIGCAPMDTMKERAEAFCRRKYGDSLET